MYDKEIVSRTQTRIKPQTENFSYDCTHIWTTFSATKNLFLYTKLSF